MKPMVIPSEDLKICGKCGVPKPISNFYLRKSGPARGRPQSHCRSCIKARVAIYRELPGYDARHAKYYRKRRIDVKAVVFAAYGDKCACCGEREKVFLTIDHVNNDGAAWRREMLGNRNKAGIHTYRWLVRHGFPEGFQVLCMNCQWGKKINSGVCPHRVTCNDYPFKGVGSSEPKQSAPHVGDDIVCPPVETRGRFIN